jgi:hypothetical protein
MSGGITADRLVHVVFVLTNGNRIWFSHTDRRQHPRTFEWQTVPVADDDPRQSRPMRYDMALMAAKRWREEFHYSVRLALEQYGEFIDEPEQATPALAERTPKHAIVNGIDILVIPGSDRFYYVRFPGSAIESLKGNTPEEAVDAFEKMVVYRPELAKWVERYVPPAPRAEEPVAQQQTHQQFGRRRPGDVPR